VDYFHVFSYSKRKLAESRNFVGTVPVRDIQKRSKMLRDLSNEKRFLFHQSLIGSDQKVLFEQNKDGYWTGLTDNYARVYVKSRNNLSNCLENVKLLKIQKNNVLGEVIK